MASDDLRARIAEALCPPHHRVGSFSSGGPVTALSPCQLHQAQADTVMAVVQPELDRLTAERHRLSSGLLHLGAEAHRRKWAHDAGEDRFGNPISVPAFDELHRIGNELLALRNAKPQPTTKESLS